MLGWTEGPAGLIFGHKLPLLGGYQVGITKFEISKFKACSYAILHLKNVGFGQKIRKKARKRPNFARITPEKILYNYETPWHTCAKNQTDRTRQRTCSAF